MTDELRLQFVRELWTLAYETRRDPLDALYEYERLTKEHMRDMDTLPAPPPEPEFQNLYSL